MKISEIFHSIQGEGRSVGHPTIFIRFGECNLRCRFCDSKYAFKGEERSLDNILSELDAYPCRKVCITGGEPLFQKTDFDLLVEELFDRGYEIEVETNGTIRPSLVDAGLIQWNVSPKLSNSFNDLKSSIQLDVLEAFNNFPSTIFKFVVGGKDDFEETLDLIKKLDLRNIYMMPEGVFDREIKEKAIWLIEECKRYDFYFSPRLHVWLWEGKRGY